MRPHEEEWEAVGCGNPEHGPEWGCWKVKNATGGIVLRDVDEATAERYAAFPDMARALIHVLNSSVNERTWNEETGKVDDMKTIVRAALIKAGVL